MRIFLGSLVTELIKLYSKVTINAVIYRIGQKPGEIIAEQILERYNKKADDPFDNPSAAFNLLENSVTQLFDEEQIGDAQECFINLPANISFYSIEPIQKEINLECVDPDKVDLIILGGLSGKGKKPEKEWVQNFRNHEIWNDWKRVKYFCWWYYGC